MPNRIQLKREKGWRKPAGVVVCSRPTCWGNRFDAATYGKEAAVKMFLTWLETSPEGQALAARAKIELRGKDLACWCRLDEACHVDILLKISNERLSTHDTDSH